MRNADIDTNLLACEMEHFLNFTNETDKVATVLSNDRASFHFAFHLPVQVNTDTANLGQFQLIAFN
ncbi:hypothetical protein CQU01_11700 [Cerasibacillus quisquiliarum]|uniref:Uncharacterized protein n=1 Tax=Cerasibacillus quisquiliarum TaxID=227865 RepID=A0A511V0R7_9BACI|nr:hypothetical protein CQU01_11700 [Cerasibacillus quisquiliarum]